MVSRHDDVVHIWIHVSIPMLEMVDVPGAIFTRLLSGECLRCSSSGLHDSALGILRDMQKDGVAPDRNSYFFVISACSRRGEARTALNLLAEMRRGQANGGPMLDLLLYGVAIKACAGGGYWRQALGLLEEMESAGGEEKECQAVR